VQYPPGNNDAVRDIGGFATATRGLDTYATSSTTEGASWALATKISTVTQMPNDETFGERRVPLHGDDNDVSSVGAFAYNAWTDTRQVVAGNDPRYIGGESFDVLQCRPQLPDGTFGIDNCPNAGSLDQNIFGAATTG